MATDNRAVPPHSMRTKLLLAGVLGLLAITGSAYLPVFRAGFIWDDNSYVMPIKSVQTLDGLRRIWFEPATFKQYYPLCYTSFWIEHQFWGLDSRGYHVVNVALHAANAVIVWLILRRLELRGAWVAAAIFTLHPVNVETVAWITERRNTLSALFYLLSILAYLRFCPLGTTAGAPTRGRWVGYALALLAFLAALLSKTVTCTLPAALLLLVWWKRRRIAARDVWPLVPFFLLAVGLSLITFRMESGIIARVNAEFDYSALQRVLIAGRAAWFYLGKLLLPIDLIHVYPRWTIDTHIWWQYLFPAGVLGLLGVLWSLRRRVGNGPLVAVLFFGGTLLPNLGFVNFGFMDHALVADRFEYLPGLGIIALVVGVVAFAVQRAGPSVRRAAPVLSGVVLLGLGVGVWQRATIFESSESLWRATLDRNPDCAIGHFNLSCDLLDQKKVKEAIPHLEAAVRLRPRYLTALSDLGAAYVDAGRYDDALRTLTRLLQWTPNDAITLSNLGLVYARLGRYDEAAECYRRALAIEPNLAPAREGLNAVSGLRR